MTLKRFKPSSKLNPKAITLWAGVFAVIGVTTLLLTRAATPGIPVVIDSTLSNPTNVKAFADDRVATISWDAPSDAATKSIIGYYVTWGTQGAGTYTDAKQTTYTVTQIQPLVNGTLYNVKVQSVQGSLVNKPNVDEHGGPGYDQWATANGKVSSGVTTSITPSSARVDQLRTQMTGFFDDFNTPNGPFNELLWNHATSACVPPGAMGAFVNNQFHAHDQLRSTNDCDRGQKIARPRTVFDITGRTEANPGVIVMDLDGATFRGARDFWYLDLIPLNARKNNIPLDITSHASAFDNDPSDPVMIRVEQLNNTVHFKVGDANKSQVAVNATGCGGDLRFCSGAKISGLSPLAEPATADLNPVPNVRRHWRFEFSPTKMKIFIDSTLVLTADTPSYFTNVKQFAVHSNMFSYNTGKQYADAQPIFQPTTTILHWDNFGFNGPASSTVTHNYIDGGANGNTPYLGRGTTTNPVPESPRSTKINIPDPIGTPTRALLKYTLTGINSQSYQWASGDSMTVNGHKYNIPDPEQSQQTPIIPWIDNKPEIWEKVPFADAITLNAADLKQGLNDIIINTPGNGHRANMVINVHIELDYPSSSAPAYTQPSAIFGASAFLALIQPTMTAGNSYLYVEQNMGLPSGTLDSGTPVDPPTGGDTTKPIVNLSAPANNTTITVGANINATANASDNVGVTKVEFYLGNTLKQTDTTSPYAATIPTTGMTPGTYNVTAVAYDLAGNAAASSSAAVTVQAVTPPISGRCDFNNDSRVNITDLSILLASYNKAVAANTNGDCDGNGQVNITDLSKLLSQFNT